MGIFLNVVVRQDAYIIVSSTTSQRTCPSRISVDKNNAWCDGFPSSLLIILMSHDWCTFSPSDSHWHLSILSDRFSHLATKFFKILTVSDWNTQQYDYDSKFKNSPVPDRHSWCGSNVFRRMRSRSKVSWRPCWISKGKVSACVVIESNLSHQKTVAVDSLKFGQKC